MKLGTTSGTTPGPALTALYSRTVHNDTRNRRHHCFPRAVNSVRRPSPRELSSGVFEARGRSDLAWQRPLTQRNFTQSVKSPKPPPPTPLNDIHAAMAQGEQYSICGGQSHVKEAYSWPWADVSPSFLPGQRPKTHRLRAPNATVSARALHTLVILRLLQLPSSLAHSCYSVI